MAGRGELMQRSPWWDKRCLNSNAYAARLTLPISDLSDLNGDGVACRLDDPGLIRCVAGRDRSLRDQHSRSLSLARK